MPKFLTLKDAEEARLAVTQAQAEQISSLYEKWAHDVGKRAAKYEGMTTASAPLQAANLRQLEAELQRTANQVSSEVAGIAQSSIYQVADGVVKANTDWLVSLGFPEEGVSAAFTSVPDQVVRRVVTGQVYETGWSLSKAIWSDNQKVLQDIHTIVAGGLAENRPVYDVAKQLEQYVSPDKAKQWNKQLTFKRDTPAPGFTYNPNSGKWEQRARLYKGTVDYNAQRLVRTLSQHAYQQSLESIVRNNPFVLKFVWHAEGSRACPMCTDLDGLTFDKGKLPLDHPNGMCTFEPVIDKDMVDKLADWVKAEDGTYPEIDQFAKLLGYKPVPKMQAEQFIAQYGKAGLGSKIQTWENWYKKLPAEAQQAASTLKMESGEGWATWYANNVYTGDKFVYGAKGSAAKQAALKEAEAKAEFLAKYGKAGQGSKNKTWNTWYDKLSAEQQAIVKAMKEESGQGWATWYAENIYTGDSFVYGAKGSYGAQKAQKAANAVSKAPVSSTSTKKAAQEAVAKYLPQEYSTTSPLYNDVYKKFGMDTAEEFKMVLHEAKEATGKVYHIDVWKSYKAGTLDTKYASQLDKLFADGAKQAEKQAAEAAKAAKKATEAKRAEGAKKSAQAWQDVRSAVKGSGVKASDSRTWVAGVEANRTSTMLATEDGSIGTILTDAERSGIKAYSGSAYDDMNGLLRALSPKDVDRLMQAVEDNDRMLFNRILGSDNRYSDRIWDASKGLKKVRIEEEYYVRRGTSIGELGGLFIDGPYSSASAQAKAMSVSEMNQVFKGKVGTYKAFTSTSAMYEKGFSGNLEVIIRLPKGTEAQSIMSISNFKTREGETLIQAGTKVKFVRAERSDGHKGSSVRVFLEAIPQH